MALLYPDHRPTPTVPWILVDGSNKPDLEFYSIPSTKFYTIHAPKFFSSLWGPAEGYILTDRSYQVGNPMTYQVSLLNPLNNHEIPLPAIDFGYTSPLFYAWKNQMGKYLVCHVDEYISRKLDFWQLGQNNWCQLNLDLAYKRGRIFYLKNMFFTVERKTGVTNAIDMGTGTLVYTIPPIEDYTTRDDQFMVEDSGDILRVIRHGSDPSVSEQFDVYQLEENKNGPLYWGKVTSIGNRALFIDWRGTLILTANDFAGIKRNSIYFFVYKEDPAECGEYDVKRKDIETGAVEHLPWSINKPGYWFVPNLQHM